MTFWLSVLQWPGSIIRSAEPETQRSAIQHFSDEPKKICLDVSGSRPLDSVDKVREKNTLLCLSFATFCKEFSMLSMSCRCWFARYAPRARLVVESLEERWMPTVAFTPVYGE